MQTVHTIAELRTVIAKQKAAGKTIGFAPTMGNLHEGHITLIREGHKHADFMVSSIFVNPTQFGEGEDFDAYPRTLEADSAKLEAAGCHCLFAPSADEMYPAETSTWASVQVHNITHRHCGADRPGHFDGVSTVVTKLFNIVTPDVALFGKKDFQQLAVIRRMTKALCFNTEIIGVETVREESGLAMSSRNGFLTVEEKNKASTLYQQLCAAKEKVQQGNSDFEKITNEARSTLTDAGFGAGYFTVCNASSLEPATKNDTSLVILATAQMGGARLIDNIDFERSL
ncbi:MAG: pantoate--beta-alanine ligase [Pseudomonadales bacterium]|nr:pantoate--beta-alanine ligase [Pseudomonadales bacterium]